MLGEGRFLIPYEDNLGEGGLVCLQTYPLLSYDDHRICHIYSGNFYLYQ